MADKDTVQGCQRTFDSTFVSEGTMVAFPLCFPGVSAQIPADESRITAVDVAEDGTVCGGTSGVAAHLFMGWFRQATGGVVDMGQVSGGVDCVAVCCGTKKVIGCVNGAKGGSLIAQNMTGASGDLIQEWAWYRRPYKQLGGVADGERIVHAVRDSSRELVVGVTERHVFSVEFDSGKVEVLGEVNGVGRVGAGLDGGVYGWDEGDTLWRYDVSSRKLVRRVCQLPAGQWTNGPRCWAVDAATGTLYTADGAGSVFALSPADGLFWLIGRATLTPVSAMAVTLDGRVFGFCGEGVSRMFRWCPDDGGIGDVGSAVSVIERRRYGYQFADAAVGADGQIYFAENDDLGHLWVYFPAIRLQASGGVGD